jgi:hypothetical protein
MKPGQIAQLQDLSKCYMRQEEAAWVRLTIDPLWGWLSKPLRKNQKAWLRRLTHQYRHQIKAVKRNQKAAE